jgi:hypothetical protein
MPAPSLSSSQYGGNTQEAIEHQIHECRYAEQRYVSRRLCMSTSVLGAGIHSIRAWVVGISSISSAGMCSMGGVGG